MANLYTKRSHYPRTLMANDYRPIIEEGKPLPKICRAQARLLSPDRCLNPHPQGLAFHFTEGKAPFNIWNKDFGKTMDKMPSMLRHQRWVNFSAPFLAELREVEFKRTREVPKINYSVDTVYRDSFQNPNRLPELDDHHHTTRFGSTPAMVRKAARGIVPEARPRQYPPYQPY